MAELKPANENPWYVLMTLYGEQEREEVDQALHARNQEAWNLWAGQALSEVERAKLAERGFVLPEQTLWEGRRDQIMAGHREAMIVRNRTEFDYPGFPEPSQRIDFDGGSYLFIHRRC